AAMSDGGASLPLGAIPGAALLADAGGRWLDANAAAAFLFGCDRGELIGAPAERQIAPWPLPAGERWTAVEIRRADGSRRCVEAWAAPATVGDRAPALVVFLRADAARSAYEAAEAAFASDLTVVRLAERAARQRDALTLRASEARFRAAFSDAPIGMALTSPDGRFVQVNRALCEIIGYAEAELLTMTIQAVTQADDLDIDRDQIDRLVDGAIGSYQIEKRYLHRSGRIVQGRLSASLVRDDAGQLLYFVSQIQDVTPYKAAGAALRASEARFRAAFSDAPIGMALTSPDGRFVQVNRALCEIVGYAEAELLTKSFFDVTHPDDRGSDRDQMARLLTGEAIAYQREKRYVRRDRQLVWVEFSASVVRDEAGQPLHIVSQIQDVTARKQAEAELRAAKEAAEEASHLKSQFLAMMSHELRTPLQAIIGYADLLLQGMDGPLSGDQTDDIAAMERGARRLLDLINDVLDLSRIEAGQLHIEPETVNLAAVIEQTFADVRLQAAAKQIALVVALPPDLPPLRADPVRLRQILLNLVGNAVKFTAEGRVIVSARASAAGVEVIVADTGIGIAPEAAPHIFDEFRQADGSMTRRYGGSGLGLAIANRLVRLHRGAITVESAPGAGSTFTVTFPHAGAAALAD
ncbi:MAG TPA: PAS domain S-box protein, partial [Thermomicrobiales bacterium]|nr:PAS domain S-box protein [Thermomicrobiales bacterium]